MGEFAEGEVVDVEETHGAVVPVVVDPRLGMLWAEVAAINIDPRFFWWRDLISPRSARGSYRGSM